MAVQITFRFFHYKRYSTKVASGIRENVWREQFKALFQTQYSEHQSTIENEVIDMARDFTNLNDDISETEILGAINRLKSRAASGSDEISPDMLQCTPRSLIGQIYSSPF